MCQGTPCGEGGSHWLARRMHGQGEEEVPLFVDTGDREREPGKKHKVWVNMVGD